MYSTFRRLPVFLRRFVVRTIAPTYVVGTVVVIQDSAGAVLLLRERHHDGWGLPGGLINRGEQAVDAAIREVHEEIAITLDPADLGQPQVNTDPGARRVDIIFTLTADGLSPRPCEPEVLETRWFALDHLPELFEPTVDVLYVAGVLAVDDVD
jgi:8-oxo-dGTP pyrophosphatase MutT (NUDIX family)